MTKYEYKWVGLKTSAHKLEQELNILGSQGWRIKEFTNMGKWVWLEREIEDGKED